MTIWNVINEGLIQWAGMGLLHASTLALLAWLLSVTLLRRCPPALLAALWTVVLVKFLLPPLLPGDFSLSSWLSAAIGELGLLAADAQSAQASAAHFGSGTATTLPAGTLAESLLSFLGLAAGLAKGAFLPLYLLLAGWLSARQLLRSVRLWRWVGRLPRAGEQMERKVGELAARIGLGRPPQVLTTGESVSPFVIGLWRPRLVLPSQTLKRLDPQSVQALIVHELAHLRRRDHWVRSIQNSVRLLLFFWPPVWWVCRRIDRFAEMACDQWAVTVSRVNPQLYAESLLEVARRAGNASANQQKLAFAQRGRLMEERFEMILNRQNLTSPRLSWISLLLLAAWATFAWAGGAEPQEPSQEKKHVRIHQVGTEHPAKFNFFFRSGLSAQRILEEHPEADLNGDGELSGDERKAFQVELRQLKLEEFFAQHPQADLDGDGNFSNQEKAEFNRAQRVERLARVLEEHPDADLDGDGSLSDSELKEIKLGNAFYFSAHSEEGSEEGSSHEMTFDFSIDTGNENHFIIREHAGGKAVDLKLHLEGHENAVRFDPASDGEAAYELIGTKLDLVREHLEGHHTIEVHQESGQPRVFVKLKGKVVEFKDGDFTKAGGFLHEKETPASSEERRQRLLDTNPEADLDGDGEISTEEARSFAAKLQAAAKKKKKQ